MTERSSTPEQRAPVNHCRFSKVWHSWQRGYVNCNRRVVGGVYCHQHKERSKNAPMPVLRKRATSARRAMPVGLQDRVLPGRHHQECGETLMPNDKQLSAARPSQATLTFDAFRSANVARCIKWHPEGIASWSPSDWLTAVTGELGELASLLKMRNRERDGLPGNKFSPTDKQIADELADVLPLLKMWKDSQPAA